MVVRFAKPSVQKESPAPHIHHVLHTFVILRRPNVRMFLPKITALMERRMQTKEKLVWMLVGLDAEV